MIVEEPPADHRSHQLRQDALVARLARLGGPDAVDAAQVRDAGEHDAQQSR